MSFDAADTKALESQRTNPHPRPDAFGLTHVGRRRPENQDHFLVAHLRKLLCIDHTSLDLPDHTRIEAGREGLLLVVADGVGGGSGGGIASALTVDTLSDYALNTMPWFTRARSQDDADELSEAIRRSQYLIRYLGRRDPSMDGMATTLVMGYVHDHDLCIVHVGDSRAYHFSDGHLLRVTKDHTVGQEMIDAGQLTPAQAETSRWSHVLSRAIGDRVDATPDVFTAKVRQGDVLLLCSDGLTKHVTDEEIAEVVGADRASSKRVCQALRDLALARGGTDNVTIACAELSVFAETNA